MFLYLLFLFKIIIINTEILHCKKKNPKLRKL